MGDVLTPEQRSKCMSRIKGKNTALELLLRRKLWAAGLRYRVHYKLPGKPDIVFVSARVAVFIDGCFWHGCPAHSNQPKTNDEFWERKIKGNMFRDRKVNSQLESMGWTIVRVWEHEAIKDTEAVVARIRSIAKPCGISVLDYQLYGAHNHRARMTVG